MTAISANTLTSCPIEGIQIHATYLSKIVDSATANSLVEKLNKSQFVAFTTKTGEIFFIDPHKCGWKQKKIHSLFLEKATPLVHSQKEKEKEEESETSSSSSSSHSSSLSLDSKELNAINLNVGPCQLL